MNRDVLVSNLVAGGGLALLSLFFVGWGLPLVAMVYVGVSSMFLATTYARSSLSMKHEFLAWIAPWLLAVTLWTLVGASVEGPSGAVLNLWFGFIVGTGCYLVWQMLALAVRQVLAARAS